VGASFALLIAFAILAIWVWTPAGAIARLREVGLGLG
jgi:hypothetical protein